EQVASGEASPRRDGRLGPAERLDERQRDVTGRGGLEHDEHDLVADVLDELPPILRDRVVRAVLELVEEVAQSGRGEILSERAEPDEVDEAHGEARSRV